MMEYNSPCEPSQEPNMQASSPIITEIANGATYTIPPGAHNWTISVLAGTATIDGEPVSVGFSDSSEETTLQPIVIVANETASTVYIRYGV